MNKKIWVLSLLISSISVPAHAALFSPTFDTPPFPGSMFDVDSAHNAYYEANYGIHIDNAYLYVDSRDTFDGIGIANGTISGSGSFQIGRIDFLDSTDFVNVDYLAILDTVYEAFDSHGSLLSSFNAAPGTGSFSLSGGIISYLTFKALGGYGAISGLSYNYDGITDGRNDDLNQVPVPAAVWLFGSGLMGLLGFNRKRSQSLAV